MDLFQIASENTASLAQRFEDAKVGRTPEHAACLTGFADRVTESGTASINMRPWVLGSLLSGRPHQNIYEWAAEQASLSGRPRADILRERLRSWYDRRVAFDAAFDDGERFRYGALYLGGLGASSYGQFCTVLREEFLKQQPRLAHLANDSLSTYVSSANVVDEEAIRRDSAPHSHRGLLAALKHADALPGKGESDWAALLCNDSDYVEAIFVGDLTAELIERVRVSKMEYNRLWNLAFSDFGAERKEEERALAHDFESIVRLLGERDMELEQV
jgi:hypothetical protein